MTSVESIVNARLPQGQYSQELIAMAVEEAEYRIRNYCNLPKPRFNIPIMANYVWAGIAIDALLDATKILNPGSAVGGALGSVSVGDTSFSFVDWRDATVRSLDANLNSYSHQLNRFRRMFWNDGEEYEGEEIYDNGSNKSI